MPCCGPLLPFSNNPAPAHCWVLTAAIMMQKLQGSVKLTCPENQCHIMRRLENLKHEDLAYQGYTYSLESNQPYWSPGTWRITSPGQGGKIGETIVLLADPGEARGCSTNTSVLHSFIHSFSDGL